LRSRRLHQMIRMLLFRPYPTGREFGWHYLAHGMAVLYDPGRAVKVARDGPAWIERLLAVGPCSFFSERPT